MKQHVWKDFSSRLTLPQVLTSIGVSELLILAIAFLVGTPTSQSVFHGGMVVGIGICILLWCAGHSRPGRLEGGDVSGPWLFVRHPETVARFLIVFGAILVARTPWIFGAAVILLGMQYRFLVKFGDQELSRWLGPAFSIYRLFVSSFLPQFLPARLPQYSMRNHVQSSPWSFRKAWRRKSLRVLLSFILIALAWMSVCSYLDLNPWWQRLLGLALLARLLWSLRGFIQARILLAKQAV